MTNEEIIQAMIDAYDGVYEAEIKIGSPHWTDNKRAAMRAAFAVATPLIREQCAESNQQAPSICGACGQPWTGEQCGQAKNDWPFPTCYPTAAIRQKGQTL